jgi:GNAT superfamily N-acetyltransferase
MISYALLEQVEAETWADFVDAASAEAKADLGSRQLRIGGGFALAVPNDPTGFYNAVTGLGFAEPITGSLMRKVIDFYRELGVSRVRFSLAPHALPADWKEICREQNITGGADGWTKLAGDLATIVKQSAAVARLDDGLRVAEVPADRARGWASVMLEGLGQQPGKTVEMGVGLVGRPGWRTFAAFEGDAIVGTACLHIADSVGQDGAGHLFAGETLPPARRRGVQSTLIAVRAQAAYEAGCTWLIGESGAEKPGEHNQSLHNQLRAGLTVQYLKPVWRWEDPERSAG